LSSVPEERRRAAPIAAASLVAFFLAALALRPQLVGIGPLLPAMQDELGFPHGVGGLLTTLPVLCMAAMALPAVRFAHHVGLRTAMAISLGGVLAFGLLRPLSTNLAWIFVMTAGLGIGMGIGGALLPRAVKATAPHRAGFATGIYTTGIALGAAGGAAFAGPIGEAAGWQVALLVLAAVTAPILVAWLAISRRLPSRAADDALPRLPLRSPLAWRLVGIFSLNSLCFYGLNTWLPSIYVDLGWSVTSAGALAALMNAGGLPASVAVPWISDRSRHRNGYVVATGLVIAVAIAGILFVPTLALLWVILVGLALGALFPLTLTLPLDAMHEESEVAGYAAMMLTGGYAVAALGPVVLGVLRDATGDFSLSLWTLIASGLILALLALRPIVRSPQAAGRPAA
jgi:CP family cyanate transporter-like MFS transporter